MKLGYFLASEEWGPHDLVRQAVSAQQAGFDRLWISDHYHPWNDEQGHSPFVWSTIGAIAQATERHDADHGGDVSDGPDPPGDHRPGGGHLGGAAGGSLQARVGSGEALNEHILGDRWPRATERLDMLEEAIEVIRLLWQGGVQSHRGRHYLVEHCRVYDLPERPPQIVVSGFGPKSIALAARVGDGYCTVGPDAEAVQQFRSQGGGSKLVQGGLKVCWDDDAGQARRTVRRLWPNEGLPGELAQVLPTPEHFEQATQLVTEEQLSDIPCGSDVDEHVEAIREYERAGFDELYINQIGPEPEAFFAAYRDQVLPGLAR